MVEPEGGKERRDRKEHYRRAALFHPLRRGIVKLTCSGVEATAIEIAGELGEELGRVGYHVRVLVRRGALAVVPRRRPAPPLYRLSSEAEWARRMLAEIEERRSEDD